VGQSLADYAQRVVTAVQANTHKDVTPLHLSYQHATWQHPEPPLTDGSDTEGWMTGVLCLAPVQVMKPSSGHVAGDDDDDEDEDDDDSGGGGDDDDDDDGNGHVASMKESSPFSQRLITILPDVWPWPILTLCGGFQIARVMDGELKALRDGEVMPPLGAVGAKGRKGVQDVDDLARQVGGDGGGEEEGEEEGDDEDDDGDDDDDDD
jgi:hypothetical protein